MRVLVVSTHYRPDAIGGYEIECAAVVEHLAARHELLVLTSGSERYAGEVGPRIEVRRELTLLSPDHRGSLRAPAAALGGTRAARRALAWGPDLVYAWNGAAIPHAALRVLADSPVPLAFRVCEHWFGGIFWRDQFMRELLPARRAPARAIWAAACRAWNTLPALRLQPTAPVRTAVSWNSDALRRLVKVPPFIDTVLERVEHAVPPRGDLYAAVERHPNEWPELVFVGRITPQKGVSVAIEALARLRARHEIPAKLVLAGPAEESYERELRRLAEQLDVAGALNWRGPVPPEEVAQLLAGASAMIVPSTWDEPLGLVMIEGALARVPLVASDVGGIGEAMIDEEHALLFPRGDANAAAHALLRTVRETEQTAARVGRAYERAQSFRLGPYLANQERFVFDAVSALRGR